MTHHPLCSGTQQKVFLGERFNWARDEERESQRKEDDLTVTIKLDCSSQAIGTNRRSSWAMTSSPMKNESCQNNQNYIYIYEYLK